MLLPFRYYVKGCVCMPFKEINVKSAIEQQREKDNEFKEAWDLSQKEYVNQSSETPCYTVGSSERELVPKS